MCVSCSVVSNSLRPHGLGPAKLLSPWDFPGKNIAVGCHSFLQGIFLTQGIELGSPTLNADSLPSEPSGKTTITSTKCTIFLNLKNKTSYLNYLLLHCCCLVVQSRLTLCSPTDCSLPDSSVHGIFQARILQWVAFSYSRRSSSLRD